MCMCTHIGTCTAPGCLASPNWSHDTATAQSWGHLIATPRSRPQTLNLAGQLTETNGLFGSLKKEGE